MNECTGDINQLHMLARDYPHISLLCGLDDQAVAVDNDIAKGRWIMSALMPFMRTLEQGGKLIQFVKHACELQGLPAGTVRRPLGPLLKSEKRELEMVLRTLKSTMAEFTGDTQSLENDDVGAINT